MYWLRNHPYVDALIAAGIISAAIALVVWTRIGVTPASEADNTWSGGGVLIDATSRAPSAAKPAHQSDAYIPTPTTRSESLGSIPLNYGGEARGGGAQDVTFDDLVAELSHPASQRPAVSGSDGGDAAPSAYAFIPRGLIAATSAPPRTPLQDALYAYGNEVGDSIQAFENSNPHQEVILKNFIENRNDAGAIAAMKKLGSEMSRVGDTLANMDPAVIPSPVQQAHAAFIASYHDMGTKLSMIPDARSNDALLAAIEAYDTAANTFVKRFVALALIFQSYDVVFSPTDGGSTFTFSAGNQ